MTKFKAKPLAAYAFACTLAFSLHGGADALVIDNFDEGGISITANASNPFVQTVSNAGGIIGGERESSVIYYAPTSSAPDDISLRVDFVDSGAFSHNQDAGVAGLSIFTYDGNDGDPTSIDFTGLGGLDLTEGGLADRFVATVLFADLTQHSVLDMRVYTDATHYSDLFLSFPNPINSPTDIHFRFSDFVLGDGAAGLADFTNVGAILFGVDGRMQPSLDVRIDSLTTLVIPEPVTLALVGIGLAGAGIVGRRRRRAAV